MGKNTDQIATFADLYSIGYRVPSGKETSKECVTYDDVKFMDEFYNSTSKMQNVYIGATYYNGSQYLELDTSNSDVGDFSGTFATSTQYMSSGSKSFLVGNITAPGDLDSMIVWLPIYIKIQMTQSSSNRYFNMRLRITNGSYTTWTSDWLDVFLSYGSSVFESGSTYLNFGIDTSSMYSGNVYQVYIDCEHNEYMGARVAFELHNDYTITAYSSTKCVPWKYIKGSSGQLSGNSVVKTPAQIWVSCTLTETVSLSDPDISYLGFIYHYVQNGSEKTYTIDSRSNFEVANKKNFTIHLPINLKTDSDITDDWLEIALTANTGASKHYYKFSVVINGETQTKTSSKTNGRTTMTISGRYNDVVRGLESINIKIYN